MCVCVCLRFGLTSLFSLVSKNIPKLQLSPVSHRFAKNLSPDKINLSTLKGEGQLTNLELDEEVLQSLLDLPTWLAINRVECNKAAIRVSITSYVAFSVVRGVVCRRTVWFSVKTKGKGTTHADGG